VYNAICVIVDRYTKMALYLPIVKTITITELADLFLNKVVHHFRTPRGIISNYSSSPRSPTARVHVAAGGNIVGKSFLMMAKCRGDGGEPSQRAQRAGVATLWC
jgi:hypothetical protein